MTPEDGPPAPPPEAQLIRLARDALRISPEGAAGRMTEKFSGARWRQIEAGYRKDIGKEVRAKPPTLAHMAIAVGLSPEQLVEAGREDAAEILREMLRRRAAAAPYADLSNEEERIIWSWNIPESARRNLIDLLRSERANERRAG